MKEYRRVNKEDELPSAMSFMPYNVAMVLCSILFPTFVAIGIIIGIVFAIDPNHIAMGRS